MSMTSKRRAILWFRNDLRLHDNESLKEALSKADEIIPIYVFEDKLFKEETKYGFRRTGPFRVQFVIEALQDLKKSLQDLGTDLYVYQGNTAKIIRDLVSESQAVGVFCNRERTPIEVEIQDEVEQALWKQGKEVSFNRGKMLYYTADLPFPIKQAPDQFQAFKREVERYITIREPLEIPEKLERASFRIDPTEVPTIEDFGFKPISNQTGFPGGESVGIQRLNAFIWEGGIEDYFTNHKSLTQEVSTSKLSPYIANGCVSPKKAYFELKKYIEENQKSEETDFFFHELLKRDFFRIIGKKYTPRLFEFTGIQGHMPIALKEDHDKLKKWINGKTDSEIVNNIMTSLAEYGWLPQSARWVVASYLVNSLKVNWLMGAEYFESMLLDYDPCSNYGNWNELLGIGSEPREFRPIKVSS